PRQYEHLKADLEEHMAQRESSIDDIKKELRNFLHEHGIEAEVEGRVKNLYSIYKKLKLKSHTTLADVFDVFAIRIIVPTKYNQQNKEVNDHLYALLGLIHSRWRPIGDRFKDYVAVPKPNGYQSLHTAVVGLSRSLVQPTEIQIRSQRMHSEAEYGIASHWLYEVTKKSVKKGQSIFSAENLSDEQSPIKKYVDWIQSVSRAQGDLKNGKDLLEALKIDAFTDRIYVMTPTGDIKDLPQGATPVDFAYAVHTDIGHRCQLARVNGSVVPMDYALKNGDIVEIVLGKHPQPKPVWLSYVKTTGAKNKIRAFIRSMDKEHSLRTGKEMINKLLEKMGKPPLDETFSIFKMYNGKRFSLKDRIGLVEEIGNGSVLALPVVKKVFGVHGPLSERVQQPLKFVLPVKKSGRQAGKDDVFIAGEAGLPYRFANCCKALPGLPIVGYINRGHSVIVHLQSCKHLRHAASERILEARWGAEKPANKYSVKLSLVAKDRAGLIRDIADVVTGMNVNIIFFSDLGKVDDLIHRELVIELTDNAEYDEILARLLRIRNILEVKRADFVR
ncbi:MAG TPA: TGS domain-containing protein, partial [Candidatus Gracilibacteria bacterium]|nr:TGS domain-containing protein [Candidatus Gracilibacteria bacterium]